MPAKKETESSPKRVKYVLRLYVTGTTARSQEAIRNIKMICENELKGQCDLKIIDIYQQPTLAKGEQIVAAPTLIKKLPTPLRRFVGDLSDHERVLFGLDFRERELKPWKESDESKS